MRDAIVLAALLVVSGGALAARPQAPSKPAREVAAALQKKYDTIRDFTADFVHNYESGMLHKKLSERGTVRVKKPGKMRWDYKSPDTKLFVSDGLRIYSYVPADNQVIVSPVPPEDQATTAVLFLVGKGNLTRDFTVTYAQGGIDTTYALRLEPRLPERDYDWLQLVVDRASLQFRELTAADKQGGRSTFVFSNFKENVGLADKIFAFKIPRGADVITSGSPSR
ncbi:MAG: outer membrane lipoprotein carrier protein LolA [Acidobacteria bacterium RIFCSPLOWO2_02_FULL_67_36]|nr:MAG: outer membrane lipoprotein carrier protein LolA [Acidobacteria bacterium RIFCSPLOWO2_02_FULL_67_36]OFW18439.1 MAG: outer membrane lipoprotein carrier protein LolA [Acidobacteria bacterium RIFCSPLOWO2_12_FULL_66_21]